MKKNIKSSIIDPVHGNIPVTELEYSIIDTREFQRLRHVLQNSTAYQTYPSNTNTRFPHSVGTMHIAGKMFLNALADAPKDILRGILDKLNVAIIGIEQNIKKSISIEAIEHNFNKFWIDKPAFNHRPRVSDNDGDDDIITLLDCCEKSNRHSDYFLICTAYEAIRIGALVHDIGHMPLSHIFEDAVSVQSDEDEFPVEHDWNAGDINNNPISFVKILAKDKVNNREKYQKFLNEEQKEQLSKVLYQSNETYNSNKFELHELKGLYIFNNICKGIIDKEDIYDKLVVSLTQNILLSIPTQKDIHNDVNYTKREQNSTYELYGFCHSFFANGFIDADRLDYTIRDPKSSGLNLGNLNLDLLYDNITVRSDNYDSSVYYFITWYTKATPSIERFFHQRYLGYKHIAYNYSVMRTNAIAKKIIAGILNYSLNINKITDIQDIAKFMGLYAPYIGDKDKTSDENEKQEKKHITFFNEEIGGVIDFDDAWFRTLFTLVLKALNENNNLLQVQKDDGLKYLRNLLTIYLHRKCSSGLYTFWKTESDFNKWHINLFEECCSKDDEFRKNKHIENLKSKILYDHVEYKNTAEKVILSATKNILNNEQLKVRVLAEYYSSKIFDDEIYPVINITKIRGEYFEEPSPYMSGLTEVKRLSPTFGIFLVGDESVDMDDTIIKKVEGIIGKKFINEIEDNRFN